MKENLAQIAIRHVSARMVVYVMRLQVLVPATTDILGQHVSRYVLLVAMVTTVLKCVSA